MKDKLCGKLNDRICWIKRKYLIDDGSEDKKGWSTKKCVIKRKLLFEIYENCLETTQLENKINHLKKRKLTKSLFKKLIKNSKKKELILKSQKIFKKERHNVFTEKIIKIAANLDKNYPNWLQFPDLPYRLLVIEGSGSGKTNSLFNLTSPQPDIDEINLYGNDPYDAKYQFVINKREKTSLKQFNDSKWSMDDIDTKYWRTQFK